MLKILLALPVAAAVFLGACNVNNEVEPDIRLEESPGVGVNDTSQETQMQNTETSENDERTMTASPSPTTGVMLEDDDRTIRMEGGVDSE